MSGLYVHVPFCSALCPYCDFAVVVGRPELHERYVEALLIEFESAAWPGPFDTVFIGGGTPSFVGAALLERLIGQLGPAREVTMEANPESLVVPAGVTRVSIGAQSFAEHVLTALGRTHGPDQTVAAVEAARAADVANLNLDLIYGTPGETDADWAETLERAIALGPEHLSCYALTIEDRTAFGTRVARGEMPAPDEDVLADRYEMAERALEAAGFRRYEVSNWAKPGYECAHNLTYWNQRDYLGLGLGAHSHRDGHRWANTRSLSEYLADPARAVASDEHLSEAARAHEWLSLRLRLADGFDIDEASSRIGADLAGACEQLAAAGLLRVTDGRALPTTRGMLLDNEVTGRLLGLSTH